MRCVALCAGAALLAAVAGSCTKKNPDFCDDNADCTQGVCDLDLNRCVDDVDAGDEADAAATAIDAAPVDAAAAVHVSVSTSGTGTGTVTSTPAGINCGSLCDAVFPGGSTVTLNPIEGASSILVEWTGDCTGFAPCELGLDADKSVDASFGIIGEHLWSEIFPAGDEDWGVSVAYGADGSLAMAGTFGGTISFGGDSLVSDALSKDIFVVKFAADGSHSWSRRFGASDRDVATSVAVDDFGNVVVGAMVGSELGPDLRPGAGVDLLVLRLNSADGEALWTKHLTVPDGAGHLNAVSADPAGNIVVGGDFTGTIDLDGGQEANAGAGANAFVALYSPSGAFLRSASWGDDAVQSVNGLAMDAGSNVYVAGTFSGSLMLGFGKTASGPRDGYLVRIGATGTIPWVKQIGGSLDDEGFSVAVDRSDGVYVVGTFRDVVDFGDGNVTAAGRADVYLVSYGRDGAFRWARTFGSDISSIPDDTAFTVSAGSRDHVVVGGFVIGSTDFGGGALSTASPLAAFVADFDGASGSHRWSKLFGADTPVAIVRGVAIDPVGRVAITGMVNGTLDFGGGELVGDGDVFVGVFGP